MTSLHLRVVSQEQELVNCEAVQITAPAINGEVTILPGHAALVAELQVGVLTYVSRGKTASIVISAGFLTVSNTNQVIVIVDNAVDERSISLQKAEAAVKAAQKSLLSGEKKEELLLAEASLRRAMLEVKVAQRTKKTTM